ncbi:HAD family hydrolase [Rathayibacter soli]|uniref:HAD family hydrolase n=1 Tax=Rathayibacter soli TaxID=3144168 RepID=UPI0027E43C81|nr:HAD-IB family hydrolase [Glaciibacter superstes]
MSKSHDTVVAFFDVDETLVSVKTLESFLLYYQKLTPSMASPQRLGELREQALQLGRSELNRLYFALWAAQPVDLVSEAGRSWYAETSSQPGFYRANVLERLREHRQAGHHIVLVSGSFAAPLQPLADDVGADRLYCTQLETNRGLYTGQINAAMIGGEKGTAVDAYLNALRSAAVTSWGYGDHPSDLPLLEHVTNPVVVGSDDALLKVATRRQWPVMPIKEPLAPRIK